MFYRVINHAKSSSRNIFNVRGQSVEIPRNSEKRVDLNEKTFNRLQKMFAHGSSLEVKEAAGEEISEQSTAPVFIKEQSPASDLLARMDKITAVQFRAEAKEILGDKWPAGSVPNRENIVNLLKEHEGKTL